MRQCPPEQQGQPARLRRLEDGCPWDLQQTFATIAPYTIEEAYEVAEAIRAHDMAALKDELGDLLLQVVFHARMAEEAEAFDFEAVAGAIADKMIRRHPHVFGAQRELDADTSGLIGALVSKRGRAIVLAFVALYFLYDLARGM